MGEGERAWKETKKNKNPFSAVDRDKITTGIEKEGDREKGKKEERRIIGVVRALSAATVRAE